MNDVIETDVLTVGGGGAGCRAAIEAHDQGADVLMIVKGRLGHTGCTLNVGTSAAVGPWGDKEDTHASSMRDLLAHGGFLGDQELVKILAEDSPERVYELERWGVDFVRNQDGSIEILRSAAHTYPRNIAFAPRSPSEHDYGYPPGIAMMDALMEQMSKRGIRVMDDVMLIDLLKAEGRVVGATALDTQAMKTLVFRAKSTILATGSFSQVFSETTVSPQETGDGQAAAYRAGAELIDMENIQFVPTSTGYLSGAVFLNGKGETFLHRYGIESPAGHPKETMCYALGKEIWDGRGTERNNILIDMTNLDRDDPIVAQVLPRLEERLKETGSPYPGYKGESIDATAQPFETGPLAHTTTGGVRINTRCEASVPGLYAAGAVVGGVYGHARPEGYTSMITLVFGRRAGLFAAQDAKSVPDIELDMSDVDTSIQLATGLIDGTGGVRHQEVKEDIQAVMREHAWVIKDETDLKEGLRKIKEIAEIQRVRVAQSTVGDRPSDGSEWATAIELPNLLVASELMLAGSLERKESRGAFFRDDYPETDDSNWLRNIIYKQVDGNLVLDTVPVDLKYCGPDREAAITGG